MASNSNGKSSPIVTVVVIFLALSVIGSCSGGIDKEYTCSHCGRTFTNSADTRSIARTNMCEICYDNYKFSQDVKEELKKYEERHGN